MKTKTYTLTAVGTSPWFPVDARNSLTPFNVGLMADVQAGSTLTFKAQYAYFGGEQGVGGVTGSDFIRSLNTITRAAAVATITWPDVHGVQVGDSLVITGAGAPFDGIFDVASVPSTTSATFAVVNSGPTAVPASGCSVALLHVKDHAVVTGAASVDGVITTPVNFVRLNCTAFTVGAVSLTINQAG